MRTLGLRERFEPVCDLVEPLFAGRLAHARIHIGVLVGFPGDGRLEVQTRRAEGQTRCGIATGLQILEVTMCVARFTFRGRTKHSGNVVLAFHVGLCREVQIATVGLRFAGKRGLQVVFRFRTLELHEHLLLVVETKQEVICLLD